MKPYSRWLEAHGYGIRELTDLPTTVRLAPRMFAQELGIIVVTPDAIPGLPIEIVNHLDDTASREWSGASAELPDGSFAVLLNPTTSLTRQSITLMEEIAHEYFGHVPSIHCDAKTGIMLREFSKSFEQQAYGAAAAALLPCRQLQGALRQGLSVDEVASDFAVSPDLVRYRLKVAGLWGQTRSA